MRILVIEDDRKVANFISTGLGQEGYSVDVLHEGTDAGAQALAYDYDAVVLDLMLPRMDGFTVLRNLRRSRRTPVLMLTARDAISDRVQGLDAGADDYLLKPYELTELLARVRAMAVGIAKAWMDQQYSASKTEHNNRATKAVAKERKGKLAPVG